MMKRLISSSLIIIGISLVLLLEGISGSSIPSGIAIALFLILGCIEFSRLCEIKGVSVPIPLLTTSVPVVLLASKCDHFAEGSGYLATTIFLFFAAAAIMQLLCRSCCCATANLSSAMFGFFYLAILGSYLYRIRLLEGGMGLLVLSIGVAKFSDTGALLTGRLFGRRKLIPWISPGKTVEGFIGGILAGILFSCCTHALLASGYFSLASAILFGTAVSLAAAFGDLVESMLKRDSGAKDSGTIFPGLGGALDLLDSLLFCAPPAYYMIIYSGEINAFFRNMIS